MRLFAASLTVVGLAGGLPARPRVQPPLVVAYSSQQALARATLGRASVIRTIPSLHLAEVRPRESAFAGLARSTPGIPSVASVVRRSSTAEPALFEPSGLGVPFEWQYAAVHLDAVPLSVLRAAAAVTIAVIDTGADLSAPDLAAKRPRTVNIRVGGGDVRDPNGHGTFVSSLAAGSATNGAGIAGFGGDAHLLVIKASRDDGMLSDFDEANAIVYAVDHGARIINLSVGGTSTSLAERRGIEYAAEHGALVVAAADNEHEQGNPVEYPGALLQPVGSNGRRGTGLAVGASMRDGRRAFFSNTGSQLSLVAPGETVFGAVSTLSSATEYPRSSLPGPGGGLYGFGSGTSFAAPEVAGAAALVMAANPLLRAADVAEILKRTASGRGAWNPETGYGILDVAAAVAAAHEQAAVAVSGSRLPGRVKLRWTSVGTPHYRVTIRIDQHAPRVLLANTTRTSTVVTVRHGHRYIFTVTALDDPQASAEYTLRA